MTDYAWEVKYKLYRDIEKQQIIKGLTLDQVIKTLNLQTTKPTKAGERQLLTAKRLNGILQD